jgi:hypothetical protein
MFKDFSTLCDRPENTNILNLRVATDVPEGDFSLWYDAIYVGDVHKQYYEDCSKLLSNVGTRQP